MISSEEHKTTNEINEGQPVGGDGPSLITEDQLAMLKTEGGVPNLKVMVKSDLIDLNVELLRRLCKFHGLPVAGKKADLVSRLWSKKLGGERQVVHGNNLCRYCRASAYVNGSKIVHTMEDGRRVKQYFMKCTGKHGHRYTITQTEGTAKKI